MPDGESDVDTINLTIEQPSEETQQTSEPIKRRRGRPPKNLTNIQASIEQGKEPQKRTRRSAKLTASDVEALTVQVFGIVAVMTKRKHWIVDKSEVSPFSNQAAELLNSIPAKYVNGFAKSSAYFVVGFGLYNIVTPRIEYDKAIAAEKMRNRKNQQKPIDNPVESNIENDSDDFEVS